MANQVTGDGREIFEPAVDTSDTEQVAARKTVEKLRAEFLAESWKRVLGSREGRAVIWSILSECGMYHSSDLSSELRLVAQAGRKDLGYKLMEYIFTNEPAAYTLMQREASEPVRKPKREINGRRA